MWGDEGSDDEYLAALDDFERGKTPAAALAAAPKQQQPLGTHPAPGAAPHQPPAPLQQRNGAAAAAPPALARPPACPVAATAAAPLGTNGVRHLFRRPSAAGVGLPVPAAGVAAAAAVPPAPTTAAQQVAAAWRPQQDQQLQAPQQQGHGYSGYAAPPPQNAPGVARPPYPGMHQALPPQQPGMQPQWRAQPAQQQLPVHHQQQHQRPQQPTPHQHLIHHQRPQQWPCQQPAPAAQQPQVTQHPPQPPAMGQQLQVVQHPPQPPAVGQQPQQQLPISAVMPGAAAFFNPPLQQQLAVGAGQPVTTGVADLQSAPAAAGAAEPPSAAAAQPPAAVVGASAAAAPADGSAVAAAAAATAAATGDAPAEAAGTAAAAAEAATAGGRLKRKLKQLFDYLLVYDLEATCDADKTKQPQPQEIIELSCVVVDTATLRLLPSTFQRYVKPDQHPVLTQFCTELTGITQDMVDGGVPLREALAQHEAWLREEGILGQGRTFVPVTWRDWDLKVQMAMETKWRGIEQPKYLKRWVDLSAVWFKHSKSRGNLRASVEAAGLQWEGRAHSAIDDARNTARLAVKLMQSGVILGITGSFSGVDASGRFKQATLQLGGGSASGGGKPSSGGSAGPGPASGAGAGRASGGGKPSGGGARSGGGSSLRYGFGAQQQQPAKKKNIFDEGGAWNGCCFCGVRAKKRQVKRPGPNNGREFWSCGKFSMTGGGPTCEFFKFASDISAPRPAAKKQR